MSGQCSSLGFFPPSGSLSLSSGAEVGRQPGIQASPQPRMHEGVLPLCGHLSRLLQGRKQGLPLCGSSLLCFTNLSVSKIASVNCLPLNDMNISQDPSFPIVWVCQHSHTKVSRASGLPVEQRPRQGSAATSWKQGSDLVPSIH